MTPAAFRSLRIAAGLHTQQAAAKFLHRSRRTIVGWENGEPIDQMVIDYLRLVVKSASP
jgi:DNA-binding XRE family transcriptional regulator